MQSTDLITPLAIATPFAINGDKTIPPQSASGTDTSSINAGFLPITSEPLPPDGNGIAPERKDFNGMFYLATDLRVFLQNGGVITFNENVSTAIGGYPMGAILAVIDSDGNFGFVKSLIENNQYNFVSTPSYINGVYWKWAYFNNFKLLNNQIFRIGDPHPTTDFSYLPENCIWLEGAEVSRTTYAELFSVYGTTYGAGDGSTSFNLPDYRDRVIWGGTSAGYISAKLPNITGTVSNIVYRGTVTTQGALSFTAVGWDVLDGGSNPFPHGTIGINASNSNSIYDDNATTVQPPAIKVRVYTRYQ